MRYTFWVDGGAGSNNAGGVLCPMGVGIVCRKDDGTGDGSSVTWEDGCSPGDGTNNAAELHAIRIALLLIDDRSTAEVFLRTDSKYAIGVLRLNHKAKANAELVAVCRRLIRECKTFTMRHIKGHAGHPQQERAHQLAEEAQRLTRERPELVYDAVRG